MQIKQAFTWKYETTHFGKSLIHSVIVAGECFKNIKNFCKTYTELGRNVRVSLVYGMRAWEDGDVTYGYHYLVKDADTGEFTDPQYSRYTFVELHSWTIAEYDLECEAYALEHNGHPAEEYANHYCEMFSKQLVAAMSFIKSQGYVRLSNAKIKDCVNKGREFLTLKPTYGACEIKLLNIG